MTSPAVVWDGLLSMHYGFASVLTLAEDEPFTDQDVARAGHRSGLCTAGVPHRLALMTGTHTGDVRFRIEWTDGEPPLADEWEDVVEASVDIASTEGLLAVFENFHELAWPQVGPHRARYCAAGMDLADEPPDEEPGDEIPVEPDRYLLQLWPAPMADDAIVRETSEQARYWHSVAQQTPALSDEQRTAHQQAVARQQLRDYGVTPFVGDAPGPHDGWFDIELDDPGPGVDRMIDRVLELDVTSLRAAALWCVRTVVHAAGLSGDPRIGAAVAALEAGRPLPPPFDNLRLALSTSWEPRPEGPSTPPADDEPATAGVTTSGADGTVASFAWLADDGQDRDAAMAAVQAIDAARDPEPLRAALTVLRLLAAVGRFDARVEDFEEWLLDRSE